MKKQNNKGLIAQLTGNIKEKIGISILPSFSSIDDNFFKEQEPVIEEEPHILAEITEENVIPTKKDKKPTKQYSNYTQRYFQNDLAEVEERQELAKIEKEQNCELVIKKSRYYYLAALQVAGNNYVKAKAILGVKKLKLFDNLGANSTIDILAIDMAIEHLEANIAHQHGENYTYSKSK